MKNLEVIILNILAKIPRTIISASEYLSDIYDQRFFATGDASPTILLSCKRRIDKNRSIPLIVKIVPINFPHHAQVIKNTENNIEAFTKTYINTPSYAIFFKEAWMYCFARSVLSKYTPTFACIANCTITKGLPIENLDVINRGFLKYNGQMVVDGKNPIHKKWFNILTKMDDESSKIREELRNARYGCFEMQQIDGTLYDYLEYGGKLDIGIVFEFMYTKLVAAFIGRIIFTDDHLSNVGYINTKVVRCYNIRCKGCNYSFYVEGPMVSFIDLERYIFNYSRYDVYTNRALMYLPESDFTNIDNEHKTNMKRVRDMYKNNFYNADKGIDIILKGLPIKTYKSKDEYNAIIDICDSNFSHDIKTFCQIFDAVIPSSYKTKPESNNIVNYYLNLDDDSIRQFNVGDIYRAESLNELIN